ncbi:MAG: hypothetical protein HW380_836 [Magnetococcales bacterium]|nr:hypothetical protein [Magnetococcales bacterium]
MVISNHASLGPSVNENYPSLPGLVIGKKREPDSWTARFDLLIPRNGESPTVALAITPNKGGDLQVSLLINKIRTVVWGEEEEIYRQLDLGIYVEDDSKSQVETSESLIQQDDTFIRLDQPDPGRHFPETLHPGRMNLQIRNGSITISLNQPDRQLEDTALLEFAQPTANSRIDDLRRTAEQFRKGYTNFLNSICKEKLLRELGHSPPLLAPYYQKTVVNHGEHPFPPSLRDVLGGEDFKNMARAGALLLNEMFPVGGKIRDQLHSLPLGSRITVSWPKSGANIWIPHIPWSLMYLPIADDLNNIDASVDPMQFLGLRFRLEFLPGAVNGKKLLDATASGVVQGNALYWGDPTGSNTVVESNWQRSLLGVDPGQLIVPPLSKEPSIDSIKELLRNRETPPPILYFFCESATGNDHLLYFSNDAGAVIKRQDFLMGKFPNQPMVFANTCGALEGDAYHMGPLMDVLLAGECRAIIGPEIKVPPYLASCFSHIFFHYHYRGGGNMEGLSAGEAMYQSRHFLWQRFHNIGGLLYGHVNMYELYRGCLPQEHKE